MKKILTTVLVIAVLIIAYMVIPSSSDDEQYDDTSSNAQNYSEEYTDENIESDHHDSDHEADHESHNESHHDYCFRNYNNLNSHYHKHGIEMGFSSPEEYEAAASDVVNNKNALHKTEKEDGDDVYYLEETNEFVVVSTDGYIRTYFNPDAGKSYFDRQ